MARIYIFFRDDSITHGMGAWIFLNEWHTRIFIFVTICTYVCVWMRTYMFIFDKATAIFFFFFFFGFWVKSFDTQSFACLSHWILSQMNAGYLPFRCPFFTIYLSLCLLNVRSVCLCIRHRRLHLLSLYLCVVKIQLSHFSIFHVFNFCHLFHSQIRILLLYVFVYVKRSSSLALD